MYIHSKTHIMCSVSVRQLGLWLSWIQSGHWELAPFCQGVKTELRFKNAVIPAGITEETEKIQKACLQI